MRPARQPQAASDDQGAADQHGQADWLAKYANGDYLQHHEEYGDIDAE